MTYEWLVNCGGGTNLTSASMFSLLIYLDLVLPHITPKRGSYCNVSALKVMGRTFTPLLMAKHYVSLGRSMCEFVNASNGAGHQPDSVQVGHGLSIFSRNSKIYICPTARISIFTCEI